MVSIYSLQFWEEETDYIQKCCQLPEVPANMNNDERIFMRYCAMQMRFATKYGQAWAAKRIRCACIERQKQIKERG